MKIEPLYVFEWISVTERLPAESTPGKRNEVLMWYYGILPDFSEGWHVRSGEIACGEWRPIGASGNFNDRVSHWAPMPVGPTGLLWTKPK